MSSKPKIKRSAVLRLLAATSVLALIIGTAWLAARWADQELRNKLLWQTQRVAQMASIAHIKTLSGTEADINSPDYLWIKAQLTAVRSVNPQCRFIYLMGRKDNPSAPPDATRAKNNGTVFFFVDSEPVGSKDYSPPGQVYDDATAALLQVFDTGTAFVEGPVTDNWGVWISALTPLTDPKTGSVIAVLGMDIDAHAWKWDVAAKAALPMALMLALLIGMAIALSTLGITPALSKPPHPSRWNRHIAWSVLVAGLILTATLTLYMKLNVERIAEREFTYQCGEIHNIIADRIDDYDHLLLSGAALFNASGMVTRDDWHIFTTSYKIEKEFPGIQGLGFSLLIPRAELTRHIQKIRSEGFPEYNVKPAGDRELYSSIIYLEPFSGRNLRAFGYDMFSEPVRRTAMERARDTDSAALSCKVVLVQETDKEVQAGTLMYVPVYRKGMPTNSVEQRRAAIYGWVYSPYRMNDLIQGILGDSLEKAQELNLEIFDDTPSTQNLLYDSCSTGNKQLQPEAHFTQQIPLDFYGQRWMLNFTQTWGGIFTEEYAWVWLTLVGGTLITLLLFSMIRVLLNTRATAQLIAEKLTVDLRESNEKYSSIFDQSPIAIEFSNSDGGLIVVNRACIDLFGVVDVNEISGFKLFEDPNIPDNIKTKLKNNESVKFETNFNFNEVKRLNLYQTTCSGIKILDWSITPLKNGSLVIGYVQQIQDITERKKAEAERVRLEDQLHQSQKMDAIGQLASGIAHDFNNQLAIITGYAEILYKKLDEVNLKGKAEKILRTAGRSANLIKNLMAFSHKGKSLAVPVDIHKVIEETSSLLSHTINKNIEIRQVLNADSPMISGDPSQLQNALLNLAINARDVLPNGGEIVFTTENVDMKDVPMLAGEKQKTARGRYLKVCVIDNGTGMDENVKKHVFEPFFTTKPQGKGTGMGLASVYGTVQGHEGVIDVKSQIGKGTEFSMFFPLCSI